MRFYILNLSSYSVAEKVIKDVKRYLNYIDMHGHEWKQVTRRLTRFGLIRFPPRKVLFVHFLLYIRLDYSFVWIENSGQKQNVSLTRG